MGVSGSVICGQVEIELIRYTWAGRLHLQSSHGWGERGGGPTPVPSSPSGTSSVSKGGGVRGGMRRILNGKTLLEKVEVLNMFYGKRLTNPLSGSVPGHFHMDRTVTLQPRATQAPSLCSCSIQPRTQPLQTRMSEKPKVYQGVRVKITVKELLQQRRAHQAASGVTLSGGSSVHCVDQVAPSSAGLYFEPEPISSTPNYFQPREFPSCVSCEENPSYLDQILDSYLQTETHLDASLNSVPSTAHYFPGSCQDAPFCFNQSLTPGSPSDSSTLSGSLDYSYSPAQLPSCNPENYNCAPSLDTRNCGYASEDYPYTPWPSHTQYDCFPSSTTSVCCCTSYEADHLASMRPPEYFPCPGTDCVGFTPSSASASDFYTRETNCDICYS